MMMMITVALFCFLSVSLSDTRSFNIQTKEFIHAQLDWMHSSQSSDTHARDSAIPHDTGGDRSIRRCRRRNPNQEEGNAVRERTD